MFFTILWSVEDLKGFKLQNQSVFLCVIVVGFLLLQLDVDYAYQYNEKIEHNKWFNQGQKNKQDETTQLHSKVQTQLKTFGKALWEQVNVTANEFTLAEYSDPPITWVIPTLKRGLKVEICSRSRIRPFCSPLHAPDISNSQFSLATSSCALVDRASCGLMLRAHFCW